VNYSKDQGHYLANGAPDSENVRTLNTLVISDFRPEIAVQRFCACAVKNARKKIARSITRFLCDIMVFLCLLMTYGRLSRLLVSSAKHCISLGLSYPDAADV